jgi:transposase
VPALNHMIRKGLVGGVSVKNNRQLLDCRWDKNDIKDAANVADLISPRKVPVL